MNNDELITSALQGNQNAMTQIYNENVNRVYFLCMKLLKNPDNACDLTQDTFVKAFSSLNSLQNPHALSSWILTIAANLCKDFLKKSNRFCFVSEVDEAENIIFNTEDTDASVIPEQAADNAETRRLVMDIIDRLPDGQRMAIILFYYNEMSISQIAEVLECNEAAVKARLYYGRQKIKQEVLELEKKGTKLYAAVPILPLLGNIFRTEANSSQIPVSLSALSVIAQAGLPQILAQTTQNIQNVTTNSAVSAAKTGGVSTMTNLAKIIIAVTASVAVVGGVTAAIILSNNNSTPAVQTEASQNINSLLESNAENENDNSNVTSQTSSEAPVEESSSKESSNETSKKESSSEESSNPVDKYSLLSANYISSSIQDASVIKYKGDDIEKITVLTYSIKSSDENTPPKKILGYSKYPCYFDKDGEKINSIHDNYVLNDGTRIYIAKLLGEYDIADVSIKIKDGEEYKEIAFNREKTEFESKSGEIEEMDIVTMNNRQYIFCGVEGEGTGSIGTSKLDNKNTLEKYQNYAIVFTPLDSEYTKSLTADSLTFDTSEANKIAVPNNYQPYFTSGIYIQINALGNDAHAIDMSEAFNFKVGYTRMDGQEALETDAYLEYVYSYLDAMKVSYTDGDYSFTIKLR